MNKFFWPGVLALGLLFFAGQALAADRDELERRIDMLSDELDELKEQGSGGGIGDRVSVFGYGELHFNVPTDGRQTQVDQHRFVIGLHAKLADWIHFEAEIDFEHAAQELEFELAHLDFLIHPAVNFRAGVMLLPVGFLNEFHEPPLFWSVERPLLQKVVIPTTWSGAGAGIYGTPMEGVNYRLYVVNSLQSVREPDFDGGEMGAGGASGRFRPKDGIRKGRLFIDHAIGEDFAVVGRVELTKLFPGLEIGGSFYTGETTHDLIDEGGRTTLLEADIKYRLNWFEMNATVVGIWIDDAAELNQFRMDTKPDDGDIVPEEIYGWNIQAGIHVPQLMGWNTRQDFVPFVLYEMIDLHAEVPMGFGAPDPDLYQHVTTVGFSYLPIPKVALKLDWQLLYKGGRLANETLNMAVAYMF